MNEHDKTLLLECLQKAARELSAAELFQLSAIPFDAGCVRHSEISNKVIEIASRLHVANTLLYAMKDVDEVQEQLEICIRLINEALGLDNHP